ncbi:MAG TPA: hypothetical protein VN903_01230 [Polyangia bacterium]|nr:hypothetical protein [Polyangia bacterium]
MSRLARLPHEVLGLKGLPAFKAYQLAREVYRARRRWRRHEVKELLDSMKGDKDQLGVGRVIALLAMGEVGG